MMITRFKVDNLKVFLQQTYMTWSLLIFPLPLFIFTVLFSLSFNLTYVAGDIFIFVSALYAGGVKFEQLV